MTPQAATQELARELLTLEGAAPAALALLFWALMSFWSYRLLRARPEVPHQRELLWGARWSVLVMLGVLLMAYTVAYLGLTRTLYPLSCLMLGKVVLDVGLFLPPRWVQHRLNGAFFCAVWFNAWARRKEPDIEGWIARISGTSRRARLLHRLLLALLLSADAYFIFGFTYPLDVTFARWGAVEAVTDSVSRAVRTELRSSHLEDVTACQPLRDMWHHPDGLGSPETVVDSVRRLLQSDRPAAPTGSATDPYQLFISLRPGTDAAEVERTLHRAESVLTSHREPRPWRIGVSVHGHDELHASATYSP